MEMAQTPCKSGENGLTNSPVTVTNSWPILFCVFSYPPPPPTDCF